MNIRVTSTAIEIVASDLTRSLDFYRMLGLVIPEPDGPHVEVDLPGGGKLAFDTEETIAELHDGWAPPTSAGRVVIGFELDGPSSVDELYERLTGAGHHGRLQPMNAFWGQRYATVEDPDGTSVDLYAPLTS